MGQWPPSPIVEDVATALAKEHGDAREAGELKADEHPVPSRGNVDQYPLIVDSDMKADTLGKAPNASSTPDGQTKRAVEPHILPTFRVETGLPTPPSSDNEARGRSSVCGQETDRATERIHARSMSSSGARDIRASRPAVSRLQTDVASQSCRTKAGSRRAPSPYSYSRETGTFRVNPDRYSADDTISSTAPKVSPVSIHERSPYQDAPRRNGDPDLSGKYPAEFLRFVSEHQSPAPPPVDRSMVETEFRSLSVDATKHPADVRTHKTKGFRVAHTEAFDNIETFPSIPDSEARSRAPKITPAGRESPYSPSAEESVRSDRFRNTRQSDSDDQPVRRRRSSHRRGKPRLQDLTGHLYGADQVVSSVDDTTRHVYRVQDGRSPMTPPTVSMPRNMEDYFSHAFQDNALKPGRYPSRSSANDAAVISPPTSPPRTPRVEYCESPTSLPYRTPAHSRNPSLDEGSFRDLKGHPSLLSQATSTVAASRPRASQPIPKSTANAIETTIACTANPQFQKPRSRAPSPQRDRLQRSNTSTYCDQTTPIVIYPPILQSNRPSTRDGMGRSDIALSGMAHPQRNASWTAYDPQFSTHNQLGRSQTVAPTSNEATIGAQSKESIVWQHSQPANNTRDVDAREIPFALPTCPRSIASQGLRDWITVKGFEDINLCPTCAEALSKTRHRSQLVRSLDKPYDKSTVCSLSKPWLRIAVVQAVKHNKFDLTLVSKLNAIPPNIRKCSGSKPDVRKWWKLRDPSTNRTVPDFFACSACIWSVHQIFPSLPDQFDEPDGLHLEQVCAFRQDGKSFNAMIQELDLISDKCHERGKSSARYMQPFVDYVRSRMTRRRECPRDKLLTPRAWHAMPDLPEFTVCEACYMDVVWPLRSYPIAKSMASQGLVPRSVLRGIPPSSLSSMDTSLPPPASCQLYSERMRAMFDGVVTGKVDMETFRKQVKQRQAALFRLTEMNKMYAEDQKLGWDRSVEIEKNRQYWSTLE